MRKHLSLASLQPLLTSRHLAVLATRRPDGTTLLSPVWHEWCDGGFSIVIGRDDLKARHVRRDPRVTILVAEQAPPYTSIEVRGAAELSRPADLHAILRRIAVRYLGEPAGRAYADGTAADEIELLRLAPGKVRAWDYRDEIV